LVVPYKRPQEKITHPVWRALHVVCLLVIFVSFVAAFQSYEGPGLSLSNLTTRPRPAAVRYFDSMQEGQQALNESAISLKKVFSSGNEKVDVGSPVKSIDDALRDLASIPQFNTQANAYRDQMIELLNEQHRMVTQLTRTGPKNWQGLEREEDELIERGRKFLYEYREWIPRFMKEQGYELK